MIAQPLISRTYASTKRLGALHHAAFTRLTLILRSRPRDWGEVKSELHAEPGLRGRAEGLRKPVGHFDRDGGLFVGQVGQRLAPDAKPLRAFSDGQPQGFRQSSRTMAPGCTGFFIVMLTFPQ